MLMTVGLMSSFVLVHVEDEPAGNRPFWWEVTVMLRKSYLFCAGAICLMVLVIMVGGCSGAGNPLVPGVQEITIKSPAPMSKSWGTFPGVWEIAFSPVQQLPAEGRYCVSIDDDPVDLISCTLTDEGWMLAHVDVPELIPGSHELMVEAFVFNHPLARGSTSFIIPVNRELSLSIINPTEESDWDIGDTMQLSWELTGDITDVTFCVTYSTDGITWNNVGETSDTSIDWEIPVIDNPGNTTFQIGVDAILNDDVLASATSPSFRIDYGPATTLFVDVGQDKIPENTFFALTAHEEDTYGNVITNITGTIGITTQVCVNGVSIAGDTGSLTPNTLGDGLTTGIWVDGYVTYTGYTIDVKTPMSVLSGDVFTIQITFLDRLGNSGTIERTVVNNGPGGLDIEPPVSKVIGIINDGGSLVMPMPAIISSSTFVIAVEASDTGEVDSGLSSVELYWCCGESNGHYLNYGQGTIVRIVGKVYYSWDFVASENGQYYFYSESMDLSGNSEQIPKPFWTSTIRYDAATTIEW